LARPGLLLAFTASDRRRIDAKHAITLALLGTRHFDPGDLVLVRHHRHHLVAAPVALPRPLGSIVAKTPATGGRAHVRERGASWLLRASYAALLCS